MPTKSYINFIFPFYKPFEKNLRLSTPIKYLLLDIYILDKLRELAWSGVPDNMRPRVWRLLLVSSMSFSYFSCSNSCSFDSSSHVIQSV